MSVNASQRISKRQRGRDRGGGGGSSELLAFMFGRYFPIYPKIPAWRRNARATGYGESLGCHWRKIGRDVPGETGVSATKRPYFASGRAALAGKPRVRRQRGGCAGRGLSTPGGEGAERRPRRHPGTVTAGALSGGVQGGNRVPAGRTGSPTRSVAVARRPANPWPAARSRACTPAAGGAQTPPCAWPIDEPPGTLPGQAPGSA